MKKSVNEIDLIKWIIILPIAGVAITSFLLTNIFISSINKAYNQEISILEKNYNDNLKNKIKERIENLSLLLNKSYEKKLSEDKEAIKDIINIGYEKIKLIYESNKNLPKEEILKIVNQELKNLRFFNDNGYYFVVTLEGIVVSLPANHNLIGTSTKNLLDKKGKNIFESFLKTTEKTGEGFNDWYWNRLGSDKKLKKIGYAKRFKPLNIYLGTAIYVEDTKKEVSKDFISFVNSIDYKDDSYIFVMDVKGMALAHKNKSIINVPLNKLNEKTQKNVKKIIEKATNSNGTFTEYVQPKELFNVSLPFKKISYIKHVPSLNLIIGTGLYTKNLNIEIEKKYSNLKKQLQENINKIIFVSLIVTSIIIFLLIILSKKIKDVFQFYSQALKKRNAQLKRINENLEEKVKTQVSHIREKDLILNQQSKLAAMGEMIGNIAHQWRQPLSAISSLASGIILQKEFGTIDDKQINTDLKNIVKNTKVLSNTIDVFRNFSSNEKTINEFDIKNCFEKAFDLISATLKNNDITIIKKIKYTTIYSHENELIQVILNILNNAKDALIEKNISKPLIFIETYSNKNSLIIKIYDNANGIESDTIDRIFEPYFTTKFKTQGTGIGLYMTKNIIENSLRGNIRVENKSFVYENEKYKGALFKIELPLNINP